MGKSTEDVRDEEAAKLAEVLSSDSSANNAAAVLDELGKDEVQELCTTILSSGHTIVHLLAQRQKLGSLRAVLQRGVDVHTRNAQGATPLHVALHHNALFSAKVLIDQGANTSEVTSRRKGTTLLHLMVTCDRPHAVLLLLEEKADANALDSEGRTPFHLAAIYGNTVITACLIRHEQCDVNAVDASGHTALMLAILNNNQELARQLVDAPRVDIVRRDNAGMSSLHLAVSLGQLEVARAMLRRNTANINGKERRMGRTPLHFACALTCSSAGVVSSTCLLEGDGAEAGAGEDRGSPTHSDEMNGNVGGDDGDSAEVVAAGASGQDPAIESAVNDVLAENAPPAMIPPGDSTPPASARGDGKPQGVANGHAEDPASTATPRPGDAGREQTPNGQTTPRKQRFARDSRQGRASSLRPTTPRTKSRVGGPDASAKEQARHSVSGDRIHFIDASPHALFLTTPSRHRHARGSRSSRPSTAPTHNLHYQFGSTFSLSHPGYKIPSISTGRDSANSQRSREAIVPVTALNVGLIRHKLVELLLEHGADANLMTLFRKAPLHITAILGAADVMSLLLPHVTNPNTLSAANKTALHFAVEGGHTAVAAQLVHAGSNLVLRDIAGMTALHLAARLGHADIVALLLKAKADKNGCDFRQMMPLHHACLQGHEEVIRLLLKAGARTDRVDNAGFRPLDYLGGAGVSRGPATAEEGKVEGQQHTAARERHAAHEPNITLEPLALKECNSVPESLDTEPDSGRSATYTNTDRTADFGSSSGVQGTGGDTHRSGLDPVPTRQRKPGMQLNLNASAIQQAVLDSSQRQQTPRRSRGLCNGNVAHPQAI